MAQANKAQPKPDDSTGNPDLDAAQARIAELEAELTKTRNTPPATVVTADVPPTVVNALDPPKKMPDGFVFNAMTGQQWCGYCIQPEHPMDPTATSWTCEHGSWSGTPRLLHPAA